MRAKNWLFWALALTIPVFWALYYLLPRRGAELLPGR